MYKIEFLPENAFELVPFEISTKTMHEAREIAVYLIQFRTMCQTYGYGEIRFSVREPRLTILDSDNAIVETYEKAFEKPVVSEKLSCKAELFIEVGYEVENRVVDRTISFKLSASTIEGARRLPNIIGEFENYLRCNKREIELEVQRYRESLPSCHGISGWR
ncbi:hypothetical protein [Vibrio crassostreae]|uniref:hypothetical protein n=1 Tax=Vibrio crassostreae TaxID=246167 RepID=UPI001B30F95F|nr:hypothetical protein [Vibrio crassostreae]